jgi:hypothetical protein
LQIPLKEGIRGESRGIGSEREGDFGDNFSNEELIAHVLKVCYHFMFSHFQPTFAQFYIAQNS